MNPADGKTKICMVIGHPVTHTLSPLIHNSGYQAAQLSGQYIYVAADVEPSALPAAVVGARALRFRGLSVTLPHKEPIVPLLDEVDETARAIGAVNTVVNEGGSLKGYNTDWLGVVVPLERHTRLSGKRVAVIGAGGAARAACFGLRKKGAGVTIFNRTAARARQLADEFDCQMQVLEQVDSLRDFDIVINATSVGMEPAQGESPIPAECLLAHQLVFDFVYRPHHTRLLTEAAAQGARVIHGIEMLLAQAFAQFELFTGQPAPEAAIRATVAAHLGMV